MDESTRTWRDRVARWHKSGHSAPVFAEQEGVNAGTLYSWSRRLGMKRSEYRQRSEAATLPALLPLVAARAIAGPELGQRAASVKPPRPRARGQRRPWGDRRLAGLPRRAAPSAAAACWAHRVLANG
ncbi:IS66 family insertion sequence element accessory protein TnpA [Sorangium sp. So ce1024]|uniref:IS66 family insertion sequence element accessory protein TnpA n=1 Tax=Sorangium sp. So ce1024 TaxID=3133327 RepID=UPI003F51C4C7